MTNSSTVPPLKVVINGGGPVGALAALIMLQYTTDVTLVEKRHDMRRPRLTADEGRSINLVLTSRGLYALQQVGLREAALRLTVPVEGRLIHPKDDVQAPPLLQPYGLSAEEVNYSVSRNELNKLLLTSAEERGARTIFQYSVKDINCDTMTATYESCGSSSSSSNCDAQLGQQQPEVITLKADLFIGADGVASATRKCLLEQCKRHNDSGRAVSEIIERIGISYKEVTFPAMPLPGNNTDDESEKKMGYSMESRGLHIWPRGSHFLMALADVGNTFTGTIYLPDGSATLKLPEHTQGQEQAQPIPTFAELEADPARLADYVKTYYPDLPRYVPDYAEQLQRRPASSLATLYCSHWHYGHRMVLVGDAAHAITPFFGQGMNLGFESVMLLGRYLDKYLGNTSEKKAAGSTMASYKTAKERQERLQAAFAAYEAYQHPAADAIAELAKENFVEMSYKTGLPAFREMRELEKRVERYHTQCFRSRYFLVTETLVPYNVAQKAGVHIDACLAALMDLCKAKYSEMEKQRAVEEKELGFALVLTHAEVEKAIETHVTPFAQTHGLRFDQPHYDGYYPL